MKKSYTLRTSILLLAMGIAASGSRAIAEPGLLLIAHGSPSREWNEPVLNFGREVANAAGKRGDFRAVRIAMLESASPDVAAAVTELEAAGCDRIIAVPLFVAPSDHTHFDVPAALGIYASPTTAAALAEEGTRPARPRVPITLTQTLSQGEILHEYALDQVRRLSRSPKEEAVVILAHGDPDHHLLVERLMRQVTTYCCGEAGISYGDWAYIGVGQDYLTNGRAAISSALRHRRRVLVVGVYLSSSALKIHQRQVAVRQQREPGFAPFLGKDVVLSEQAIVNHPGLLDWVLATAHGALAPAVDQRSVIANDGPAAPSRVGQ